MDIGDETPELLYAPMPKITDRDLLVAKYVDLVKAAEDVIDYSCADSRCSCNPDNPEECNGCIFYGLRDALAAQKGNHDNATTEG